MDIVSSAPLALDRERYGEAVEVASGLWILATRHHGGGLRRLPEANNRALILRLEDLRVGRPGLVVFNATAPSQSFAAVHRLRSKTGLEVSHVISCGGGHHAHLGAWRDEFPRARVLMGALRAPRTRNGAALLQRSRVAVMDPLDPLPEFAGQLAARSFTGLLGAREFATPLDGARDSLWRTLQAMRALAFPAEPYDELWICHRATGTIVAGENLVPQYTAEAQAALPRLTRLFIKPGVVSVSSPARRVHDREDVARCWADVLSWGGRALLGYHDCVGGGFLGDVAGALRSAAVAAGHLTI